VLEEEEVGFNREGGKKKKETCSEGGVVSERERERKNRGLRSLMWHPSGKFVINIRLQLLV
jgi:hypothetical protein